MIPSPFDALGPRGTRLLAWGVVPTFLAITAVFGQLGALLTTDAAPLGIVSFELAFRSEVAGEILASWGPEAREAAMLMQGLDFLYLIAYPLLIALVAVGLGARLKGRWEGASRWVAWAALGAAPMDAIENVALIQALRLGPSEGLAQVAGVSGSIKFACVALGVLFVLAAGLGWLGARLGLGPAPGPRSPAREAGDD